MSPSVEDGGHPSFNPPEDLCASDPPVSAATHLYSTYVELEGPKYCNSRGAVWDVDQCQHDSGSDCTGPEWADSTTRRSKAMNRIEEGIHRIIAAVKARRLASREAYAQYLFSVWHKAYTDAGGQHGTWEEYSEIALNLQRDGKPSGVGAAEIRAWRALAAHLLLLPLLMLIACEDSAPLPCPTIVEPCEQMAERTEEIPDGCGIVSSQVCTAEDKCYDMAILVRDGTVVWAPLVDGECTIIMDGCPE